jgi:hypothetical protein
MSLDRSIVLAAALVWCPSIGQAQPNKDLYELQERCGKRAEEVFTRTYKRWEESDGRSVFFDFENHYSPRLNKCFFLLTNTIYQMQGGLPQGQPSKTIWLFDLNDNRQYGTIAEAQGTTFTCELRGKQCRSEQEWRELIKPFMED